MIFKFCFQNYIKRKKNAQIVKRNFVEKGNIHEVFELL